MTNGASCLDLKTHTCFPSSTYFCAPRPSRARPPVDALRRQDAHWASRGNKAYSERTDARGRLITSPCTAWRSSADKPGLYWDLQVNRSPNLRVTWLTLQTRAQQAPCPRLCGWQCLRGAGGRENNWETRGGWAPDDKGGNLHQTFIYLCRRFVNSGRSLGKVFVTCKSVLS